ncbi:hypothetical protein [Vibrio phage JSF15]|uniref:Uncharacterized protein n=1 Tax=Vibrio phage JSF15 TaxID=1983598 RepID=A0A2D0YLR3_9CAUD|nr:hypothetical protein [Vibrio phage JSF15]
MADFSQTSFKGGVIAPRLQFNEYESAYHHSIEDAVNFVVTEQGSLITRCGSGEVGLCQDGEVRLFRLPAVDAPSNDVIVEVGNTNIAVWVNDVRQVVANTPSEWRNTIDRIQTAYDTIGDDAGAANTGRLIMVHPALQPKRLYRDNNNAWQFVNMHTGAVPAEWSPSNYPQTVGIFQNRVWYVGSPVHRTYFWATRAGKLEDIAPSTANNPNDPISFVGIMEGTPCWIIASSDVLTIGTTINDYQLAASTGVSVTAATAILRRSSVQGTAAVQGIPAEEQVIFCSRNKSKVYAMNYVREQDNWIPDEMSSQAQHLFTPISSAKGASVRRIAYISDAAKSLWVVLENGHINYCCFDRTTDTKAWTQLELSGGKVIDIAAAFNPDSDYAYVAVVRSKAINGVQKNYTVLEKISSPRTDWKRADGWVVAQVNQNGDVLNLDRYIGRTAVIFSKYGLEAEIEVNNIGLTHRINGYDPNTVYYVGYKMDSYFRTLTPSNGDMKKSMFGSKMRISKVQLALFDSIEPTVNGEPADDRSTDDIMDARLLDFSSNSGSSNGTRLVDYNPLGWENDGKMVIAVEQPFLCEVVGVFSVVQSNKV